LINEFMVDIKRDVQLALREDLCAQALDSVPSLKEQKTDQEPLQFAQNDITAMLIESHEQSQAKIITREAMVMCGIQWANEAFMQIDNALQLDWKVKDGDVLIPNQCLVEIKGNARAILTAERTALNFIQMLSGTATSTAHYVKALEGSSTRLLDTRKTLPLFRQAQKYAVRCGGGHNHRIGLFDAYLIKENHIKACGSITNAIKKAKHLQSSKTVEVEVENLEELKEAIAAGADIVMLDNFSTELIHKAVSLNNHRCKLEVSGNITQQRLTELAKTGVDFISSGAITKHVNAIDLSLLVY
jgi:nicotinate-nucleotide pyrophosphorylase (carboxylating)